MHKIMALIPTAVSEPSLYTFRVKSQYTHTFITVKFHSIQLVPKSGKCEIFAQKRANYVKNNLENSTDYVKGAYKIMRIRDLQIANSTNY